MQHEPRFPNIGETFLDRYQIEHVIGTGGFARVYRAMQVDLGRQVAIKVLKPINDQTKTPEEREAKFELVARRFEREAKVISRMKDRNTVMMYDYGRTADGLLFMVLEYVDGVTVGDLIKREGALAAPRVVKILSQCLTSLHEAHALGVLHRDIKPGNIMVFEHVGVRDQAKVLDFGIAKSLDYGRSEGASMSDVTADGVLVGTPRYMSPEQIRGHEMGAPSDIYSLGLVAYEMLLGVKAVNEESSLRIIARHLDQDPIEIPTVPMMSGRIAEIINKMLVKDPAFRYRNCMEVLADLETWDANPHVADTVQTQPASGAPAPYLQRRPHTPQPQIDDSVEQLGSPRRLLPLGIALLVVVILGLVGVQVFLGDSTAANAEARGDDAAPVVADPEPAVVVDAQPAVAARDDSPDAAPVAAEADTDAGVAAATPDGGEDDASKATEVAVAEPEEAAPEPKPRKTPRERKRRRPPKEKAPKTSNDEPKETKPVKVETKPVVFPLD